MEAAAVILPIVAGGIGAVGTLYEGQVANQSAQFEARQLQEKAAQEEALAGQEAAAKRREARLANSRNLAVAAAGGGSAGDPTVIQLMGDVEAEGQMNALTEMYKGLTRKADLLTQASVTRTQGRNARTASYIGAAGTLFDGFSTAAGRRYQR